MKKCDKKKFPHVSWLHVLQLQWNDEQTVSTMQQRYEKGTARAVFDISCHEKF